MTKEEVKARQESLQKYVGRFICGDEIISITVQGKDGVSMVLYDENAELSFTAPYHDMDSFMLTLD